MLPPGIDRSPPTPLEMARHLATRTLRAHGLAREEEMRYLRKNMQKAMAKALGQLQDEGEIARVGLEGQGKHVFYAEAGLLDRPPSREADPRARLLSPFDNAVIQRKRLNLLFGYDYQIECYVPAPKRRFGYFCLPLLFGDRFLGRVDAKADRAARRLDAIKLILEPGVKHSGSFKTAVNRELARFARFNGVESYRVLKLETRP